jgi:aspartate 1-decarboxylase
MQRIMCKSKIHRATVTEANLFYPGSITIDRKLMEEANIYPYERVQVANLTNGKRLETYAIEGEEGSGTICLNGAAARLAEAGDVVLIISYAVMEDKEAASIQPRIVHVDEHNRITKIESSAARERMRL